MQVLSKGIELPWAVAKKEGYAGQSDTGNWFWHFATKQEARKTARHLKRPIEYRPGEAYRVGWI